MALRRIRRKLAETPTLSIEEQIQKAQREGAIRLTLVGGMKELPTSVWQLKQLEHLYLFGFDLSELPKELMGLTKLRSLLLSGIPLEAIPDNLDELSNLEYLAIVDTKISRIPKVVGRLRRLDFLVFDHCEMTEIPCFIGDLEKLETLYISGTEIQKIPERLGDLKNLKALHLSNNKIKEIPESLYKLNGLQELDLSENDLFRLPHWLPSLTKLSALYLHGNPLLRLPAEILGKSRFDVARVSFLGHGLHLEPASPADILSYYSKSQAEMRPLNEAKLILLGRGNAGKTSLVNRLVHRNFQPEQITRGIKITEWDFALGEEDVRLNVWDFGGQEIMHATHQFFLTQRSLYLLVINGREGGEDADADYWLKLIENFGGDSPVIVVLNKIKEHPFSLNEAGLKRKFPNIKKLIKTDCEDGTGIDELRRAIERETDELPHLRDSFPASWFAIKDDLGKMKQNFIAFDSYKRKCRKLGERDPYWQEQLASYLHRLGIALNFRDDPRLNDTHVLNPHWVTNGIYQILNSPLLEAKKGEIELGELPQILDIKQYPVKMHPFIINLMKKFDLCFTYTDDECHYLIPELLDKQEPPEVKAFEPRHCLNFQYHYPVALEGLLPRFIVLSHSQIEGKLRWRTGAILKFEGCRALVRADTQDRKVFISVEGPLRNRSRLLAVIRSQFETIHGSFRNLEVQEMVPIPESPDETMPYEELKTFEASGIDKFPKVVDKKAITLSVQTLLNGVDLEGTRRQENFMDKHIAPIRLFISYSHKDEKFREELETHLSIMRRERHIDAWNDRKIGAGGDFGKEISENLEKADIVLLLISADFLASDYCYEKEMTRAMERYEKGEAIVIPVIVRNCAWHDAPFGKLKGLPKDGEAVTLWADKDTAWRDVSDGIKKEVRKLREKKGEVV